MLGRSIRFRISELAEWHQQFHVNDGKFRQESTGRRAKGEAEKVLRKRLMDLDEGILPQYIHPHWFSFLATHHAT